MFNELEENQLYYDAAVGNYYVVKEKKEDSVVVEDYFEDNTVNLEREEVNDFYIIREEPMDILSDIISKVNQNPVSHGFDRTVEVGFAAEYFFRELDED